MAVRNLLLFFSFVFLVSSVFAFPIGMSPGINHFCIRPNSTDTFYVSFYSGSNETEYYDVYYVSNDGIGSVNYTVIEVLPNSSVDIPLVINSTGFNESVYDATLSVCYIPKENDTFRAIPCINGIIEINISASCKYPIIVEDSFLESVKKYTLYVLSSILAFLLIIYALKKVKII